MGILDELRGESERKKLIEKGKALSAESLDKTYQEEILPKMQMIFDFFQEIIKHLQYLKEPIVVNDYSNKYPDLGELTQQDYKLSTDKHGGISHYHQLRDINVIFYCVGEEDLEIDVKSQAEIDQQINFFTAKKVPFEWHRHHNDIQGSFATFIVKKRIPVKIYFHVDYDESQISLDISNHLNFGHIIRTYKPEEVNAEILDQIAKFILRKDSSFIKEEISEEERQALKENLRNKINFGNSEYENSTPIEKPETEKKQGLFGKIGAILNTKL